MKERDIGKSMRVYLRVSLIGGALLMAVAFYGFFKFTDKVHNDGLKSIVQGLREGQGTGKNE